MAQRTERRAESASAGNPADDPSADEGATGEPASTRLHGPPQPDYRLIGRLDRPSEVELDAAPAARLAKRAFDVVIAALILVLVSPVLLVAGLAIRVTSGPHVLFHQTRVGRHGALFTAYKLRTMVPGAEALLPDLLDRTESSGPMFKMSNDPRVIPVGRILRKMSIDELPQLFNVLRGDMSLVGPRPALPQETIQWTEQVRERLRVQPGLTGNWRVRRQFTSSDDEYQRLDLYYVDNWSLVSDLVILLKTIVVVMGRSSSH